MRYIEKIIPIVCNKGGFQTENTSQGAFLSKRSCIFAVRNQRSPQTNNNIWIINLTLAVA